MYLELASIYHFVAFCHCFASYTIFQGLLDANFSTTPTPAIYSYDGIEEIMPLSRLNIEWNLNNRPSIPPVLETLRRVSSRGSTWELQEPIDYKSSNLDPHQRDNIHQWFEETNVDRRKVETTTETATVYHFRLPWFKEYNDASNEVSLRSRTSDNQFNHNHLAELDDSKIMTDKPYKEDPDSDHLSLSYATTATPKPVDVITKSDEKVSENDLEPSSDMWAWMFDTQTEKVTTPQPTTVVSEVTTNTTAPTQVTTSNMSNLICPDVDNPANIGPYEVPSERDLVRFTKTMLVSMFDSYHQRTFQFLRDIKEASKAAISEDAKCVDNLRRIIYRQCLRGISGHYEQHIKTLVNELESDRHEIKGMTEGSVCSLTEMKKDPVELIKILAVEEVSLQFALPGFLRLISSCRKFCELPPQVHPKSEDIEAKKRKQILENEAMLKYMLTVQSGQFDSDNRFRKRTRSQIKLPNNLS